MFRDYSNDRGATKVPYGYFSRAIGADGFAIMPLIPSSETRHLSGWVDYYD